jgi:molybdate transport system regulatory protein
MSDATNDAPKLSLRIDFGNGARLGPGKAALLKQIAEIGSIGGAATALGMSYPRALKLIAQLNNTFAASVITTQHGGPKGGGASLTAAGSQILSLYNAACTAAQTASTPHLAALNSMRKPD